MDSVAVRMALLRFHSLLFGPHFGRLKPAKYSSFRLPDYDSWAFCHVCPWASAPIACATTVCHLHRLCLQPQRASPSVLAFSCQDLGGGFAHHKNRSIRAFRSARKLGGFHRIWMKKASIRCQEIESFFQEIRTSAFCPYKSDRRASPSSAPLRPRHLRHSRAPHFRASMVRR